MPKRRDVKDVERRVFYFHFIIFAAILFVFINALNTLYQNCDLIENSIQFNLNIHISVL